MFHIFLDFADVSRWLQKVFPEIHIFEIDYKSIDSSYIKYKHFFKYFWAWVERYFICAMPLENTGYKAVHFLFHKYK